MRVVVVIEHEDDGRVALVARCAEPELVEEIRQRIEELEQQLAQVTHQSGGAPQPERLERATAEEEQR